VWKLRRNIYKKTPISIIVPLHHCLHKPNNTRSKIYNYYKNSREEGGRKRGRKKIKKKRGIFFKKTFISRHTERLGVCLLYLNK